MHVLFIHEAFPAQFGRLALELAQGRTAGGAASSIEDLSSCPTPTPEMLQKLEIAPARHPRRPTATTARTPWPQIYGKFLELCQAVYEAIRGRPGAAARPGRRPRRPGVAHGLPARRPRLPDHQLLRVLFRRAAIATSPIAWTSPPRPSRPRSSPVHQRPGAAGPGELRRRLLGHASGSGSTFPERFRPKIEVHFDGIDTQLYRPGRCPRQIGGRSIPPGTKVVTFVSRGLESVRGFDIFMKVARRIARARPDVLFVIVGSEEIYYGWDKLHTGQPSFKQWAMDRVEHDPSRFLFLGQIEPEHLAEILCLSDLHLYLTAPFVLSWSLINAMACGCTVLASDVAPVREVIEPA